MAHGFNRSASHSRGGGAARLTALLCVLMLALAGCSNTIPGDGRLAQTKQGGNDNYEIIGEAGTPYDELAKKSMVDIEAFWKDEYPKIADGEQFPELKSGVWSVDGSDPSDESRDEACLRKQPSAVKDNLFHCRLDDSIAYDRTSDFFLELAEDTGDFTLAAIFAHEMGHAVQFRLRDEPDASVLVETQADCFAGAWISWVIDGNASNFRISADELDTTMAGYIQLRDADGSDPDSKNAHGNGFDRVAAVADGITGGAKACLDWDSRQITERPYTDPDDYKSGGDLPYEDSSGGDTITLGPADLEAFWEQTFADTGREWKSVDIKEVSTLKCSGVKFDGDLGYCPKDRTIQYVEDALRDAYEHGDFAAMTLLGVGWGLAVVDQLGRDSSTEQAMLSAACYQGAYAATRNVESAPAGGVITLSPADMDEASIALLELVGGDEGFGDRGTTGFERIQSFIKGYFGTIGAC